MYISNYDKKQSEQMCFIRCGRLNVITIGGGGTVGVAASVRNNLKTRTSLRPVSILRG